MSSKQVFLTLALVGCMLPLLVSGTGCCTRNLLRRRLLSDTDACVENVAGPDCPQGSVTGSFIDGGTCTGPGGICVPTISTIIGDPVFTSFDNRTFDFMGKSFTNYSLISGPGLDLNMQLVPAGPGSLLHPDGSGTFVGAMAVLVPDLTMLAYVDEAGNMTFSINGLNANIEEPSSVLNGVVTYEPYVEGVGQVLTVAASPFKMEIISVKSFSDSATGYNRGHLELKAQVLSKPTARFLGVLGETLQPASIALEAPLGDAQFEIPSLVSSVLSKPPITTTTRHLMTAQTSEDLIFPVTATMGI